MAVSVLVLVLTLEEEHVLVQSGAQVLLGKGQEEEKVPISRFEPSWVEHVLELVGSNGVESGNSELECLQRLLVEEPRTYQVIQNGVPPVILGLEVLVFVAKGCLGVQPVLSQLLAGWKHPQLQLEHCQSGSVCPECELRRPLLSHQEHV